MRVNIFKNLIADLNPKSFSKEFENDPLYLKKLESDFKEEYLNRSAKYTRYSLLLGLLFYSIFGILDALIVPDQKYSLWFIRFVIVDPILIILILLSVLKSLKKYVEAFGVIALIVAGAGISVMTAIAKPPANYSYYSGIILVLMLGYGLVRIRFQWATFAGWVNVLIYEMISIFIVKTPKEILINNNFFFISANLIGMLSCYAIEYYIRRNFIFARLLEFEKENVKNLNKNLENMVKERTAELVSVNKTLQTEINARNSAETESKDLEEKLFQSQKMESLGNFAGGIAHDFNNILTSILGYTELSQSCIDNTQLKSHLEMIYSSGERAAELVTQILSFARRSEKKIEPLRPDLILKEVLKFIRSTIPTTIEIRQSIDSTAFILGNAAQLHQIFMNIITNSTYAMKAEGGILDIRMANVEISGDELNNKIASKGKYIKIVISDTGEGISQELIHSIFEPYFTTKNIGEGTGLGLAVVHGIIESYSGFITVDSTLGSGTDFIIHLPQTERRDNIKIYKKQITPRGSEKILLLDDEPSIAESSRMLLSSIGYKVTSMTNSLKALELFKQKPNDFDLIITDLMMPQMSGVIFSEEIRHIRKEIPIIICSGYDKESTLSKNKNESIKAYLNKPYSMSDLATVIRTVLD